MPASAEWSLKMCDIKAARETINKADKEIAKLFTERMHAVRKVFAYKKEHGLPIFDERRERELLRKNTEFLYKFCRLI